MSTPEQRNDATAIHNIAFLQALERQRNEAMNDAVHKAATIAVLQQQLQAVTRERDALRSEVDGLKTPMAE